MKDDMAKDDGPKIPRSPFEDLKLNSLSDTDSRVDAGCVASLPQTHD